MVGAWGGEGYAFVIDVPEPETGILLLIGVLVAANAARRQRNVTVSKPDSEDLAG